MKQISNVSTLSFKQVLKKNWNFSDYFRLLNCATLYTLTISVFFLRLALFTEVDLSHSSFLVDEHGILCAVLTPMPLVILTSPNILNHFLSPCLVSCLAALLEVHWGVELPLKRLGSLMFNQYLQYYVLINYFVYLPNINTEKSRSLENSSLQ